MVDFGGREGLDALRGSAPKRCLDNALVRIFAELKVMEVVEL